MSDERMPDFLAMGLLTIEQLYQLLGETEAVYTVCPDVGLLTTWLHICSSLVGGLHCF